MIKVVFDTNVIISAFLRAEGNPALVLSLCGERYLHICLSAEIWAEYREVLGREKFRGLDHKTIEKLLSEIRQQAIWVAPRIPVKILKTDPQDNKFLECAHEAGADFLVTGNTRHFPFKKFHGNRIVSPRDFIELLGKALFIT